MLDIWKKSLWRSNENISTWKVFLRFNICNQVRFCKNEVMKHFVKLNKSYLIIIPARTALVIVVQENPSMGGAPLRLVLPHRGGQMGVWLSYNSIFRRLDPWRLLASHVNKPNWSRPTDKTCNIHPVWNDFIFGRVVNEYLESWSCLIVGGREMWNLKGGIVGDDGFATFPVDCRRGKGLNFTYLPCWAFKKYLFPRFYHLDWGKKDTDWMTDSFFTQIKSQESKDLLCSSVRIQICDQKRSRRSNYFGMLQWTKYPDIPHACCKTYATDCKEFILPNELHSMQLEGFWVLAPQ